MGPRTLLVASVGCALLAVTAADAAFSSPVKLRKPARGFQMQIGEFTVHPGEDREWCEYRRLPNKQAIDVQSFDLRMPAGAHHFVVWTYNGRITDDAAFSSTPVESPGCVGIGPIDPNDPNPVLLTNLFGMQTPNGRVRFPKGVAVRLREHQQVWLNPHMKNFGSTDMVPQVRFNMRPARKGSVKHLAESFAIGNMTGIRVPAGGEETLVAE